MKNSLLNLLESEMVKHMHLKYIFALRTRFFVLMYIYVHVEVQIYIFDYFSGIFLNSDSWLSYQYYDTGSYDTKMKLPARLRFPTSSLNDTNNLQYLLCAFEDFFCIYINEERANPKNILN